MEEERVPEKWGNLQSVMILKKGDAQDPFNYRPITLVNTITKICTHILSDKMTKWATESNFFSEFQSGFLRGRGCMDYLFTFISLIQINASRGNRALYAIFVDFKNASPSINHQLLWQKLNDIGLS